jgi:RNA polymerase sigma-70 factor (ECF subfamily)
MDPLGQSLEPGGERMKASCVFGVALTILGCVSLAHAKDISIQGLPPVVVKTIPESGSTGVDPGLTEIRVTFSKDMLDRAWSCVTVTKETFPATAGDPRYDRDKRTFVLPVKLEPGKTYAILLNTEKFKNFKDAKGNPAMPYLLIFETRK